MVVKYESLSPEIERIAKAIVESAFAVNKTLGPGLLEHVYEVCFCHELTKRGIKFRRQVPVPIEYDGIKFDEGLRIDVLVEEQIICEFKTVDAINPIHRAQLMSYMKLTKVRLGFLINFNVVRIKDGIERIVI